MPKALEQKSDLRNTAIELPKGRFSLLSHLDNIDYSIKQIRNYSENEINPVIGYFTLRSAMGTKETDHRIFPHKKAEELKRTNPRFDYFTLNDLLAERKAYKEGRYKIRDGRFVGLNPLYSH